ncbi:MAG: glycoside hydrolase family 36 protein [bacterium]
MPKNETLESGNLRLNYSIDGGRFDITDVSTATKVVSGAKAGVRIYGGAIELFSTEASESESSRENEMLTVNYWFDMESVRLRLKTRPLNGGFALNLTLKNEGHKDLRQVDFCPLAVDRADGGKLFGGDGAHHDFRFLRNGLLTWSYTGAFTSGDVLRPPRLRIIHDATENPLAPHPKVRGHFLSEWFTLVCDTATNQCLLTGFISTARQLSQIDFKSRGDYFYHLKTFSRGEGNTVRPGGEFSSEELFILYNHASDRDELWKCYDELLKNFAGTLYMYKEICHPQTSLGEPHSLGAPHSLRIPHSTFSTPVGWCSWYCYYWKITEEKILKNLEKAKKLRARLPIEYFQIDDGYQKAVGDWLEPNSNFPHGMGWLAEKIHEAGFKAGIWLGPFFAESRSELFQRNRGWFVRRRGQRLRRAGIWPRGIPPSNLYALDTTNPKVIQWLKKVFNTICSEWGYDFVKLDFLYSGAIDGIRWDMAATRAEAFRRGLEAIREVVGDRFILGCGSPLLTAVGLVDGMRISGDTSPRWMDFLPQAVGYKAGPGMYSASHVAAHRYFMNGTLWLNDPDVLMSRFRDTHLTRDEIITHATMIALMGGMLLISDNLTKLTDESIELAQKLIPPLPFSATPLDMFESATPSLYALTAPSEYGGGIIAGVINWSDRAQDFEIPLKRLGVPQNCEYHIFELWSERYIETTTKAIHLGKVTPHASRLLAVRPVQKTPHLVASTFHFTMGGVEVKSHEYDSARKQLRILLEIQGERTGKLYFCVPDGFKPEYCIINRSHQTTLTPVRSGIFSLKLDMEDRVEVVVKF